MEKDPRYLVDMSEWHTKGVHSRCQVCMAGSVLAKTLGLGPEDAVYTPTMLTTSLDYKLRAINHLRDGDVCMAGRNMCRITGADPDMCGSGLDREIVGYHENRGLFYDDMATLLRDLKEAGL